LKRVESGKNIGDLKLDLFWFQENENRRLTQLCTVDKRAQMKLHEELVGEKLKCDKLTQQLSKLDKKLKVIGIDVTSLEQDQDFEDVLSNE